MSGVIIENLTTKKVLFNNALISLFVQAGPALIAFFTIPVMIKGLGTEKFGILTIIWSIIGASSILDFGLGHALTQFVSRKIGLKETDELPNYIITAIIFIFIMGIIATILVYLLAPLIAGKFMHTSAAYINDVINSFRLLAITIPFLMINICLVCFLESCQKFGIIGILKIPIIFCNYVAPLFVLCFFKSLIAVVSVLVIGRIISCAAYFWFSMKIIRTFAKKIKIDIKCIKPLLSFGGWMTLSNIIVTLVSNIDRFVIAGLISAKVVAYYTTPLDTLVKIWTIPFAIMSVMFPAFSSEFFANRERAKRLYYKCLQTIFIIIFPICLILFIYAKPGLTIWIGSEFGKRSCLISKIIILGVFLHSLNIINYTFIQSTGKSEIQAKIHLAELPAYLAILWFFVKHFGLIGAAFAWLVRIIIDFALFNFFSLYLMKSKIPSEIEEPDLNLV